MDLADFFCGLNIFLSFFISGYFRSLPVIRKKSENRKNRKSKNVTGSKKPPCRTYPDSFLKLLKFLFWRSKSVMRLQEHRVPVKNILEKNTVRHNSVNYQVFCFVILFDFLNLKY